MMLSLFLLQLALTALNTTIVAARNQDGFLSLPATREIKPHSLSKRETADPIVPLYDASLFAYIIELSMGTPEQSVKVAIDTGSSELWVDPDCHFATDSTLVQQCMSYGNYDPTQSSSFVYLNYSNTIPYGIGWAGIEYVTDNIALPNSSINLTSVQFGVAISSRQINEGILGLSFGSQASEADLKYNNIVDELYLQNATQSRAFSVALGSANSTEDSVIIFGGIDTSKFAGPLHTLPILGPQNGEKLYRYWIQLDAINTTSSDGTSRAYGNSSFPVVVDTGSSFCALPKFILDNMMDELGGQTATEGEIIVDCSHANDNSTFDFIFGNLTIQIPYSAFIIQVGEEVCFLGATPSIQGISLLGDSFLRSAYVVFDQKNMEVSIAAYDNCGSSEQAITDAGVSGVTGSCKISTGGGDDGEGNVGARPAANILAISTACASAFVVLIVI